MHCWHKPGMLLEIIMPIDRNGMISVWVYLVHALYQEFIPNIINS